MPALLFNNTKHFVFTPRNLLETLRTRREIPVLVT